MPESSAESLATQRIPFAQIRIVAFGPLKDIKVGSIDSRHPRFPEFTDSLLKEIASLPPKEVAKQIMQSPPEVLYEGKKLRPNFKPTPPTQEELGCAQIEIPFQNIPESDRDYIETAVNGIKTYLRSPRVADGFKSHDEERRPWEMGVKGLLKIVDNPNTPLNGEETTDVNEETSRYHFRAEMKNLADNNKYSRNRILKVRNGIQFLTLIFSDQPDQNQVHKLLEDFDALDLVQQGKHDPLEELVQKGEEGMAEIDKRLNKLSQIAGNTLELLAKTYAKPLAE